jgi:hypothetical protein
LPYDRKITENLTQSKHDVLLILISPYQGTQVDTWSAQVPDKLLN